VHCGLFGRDVVSAGGLRLVARLTQEDIAAATHRRLQRSLPIRPEVKKGLGLFFGQPLAQSVPMIAIWMAAVARNRQVVFVAIVAHDLGGGGLLSS